LETLYGKFVLTFDSETSRTVKKKMHRLNRTFIIIIIVIFVLSISAGGYMPMNAGIKGVDSKPGGVQFPPFLPTAPLPGPPCSDLSLNDEELPPPPYENAPAVSPTDCTLTLPTKREPYENMM
jgi:hypothetical protein